MSGGVRPFLRKPRRGVNHLVDLLDSSTLRTVLKVVNQGMFAYKSASSRICASISVERLRRVLFFNLFEAEPRGFGAARIRDALEQDKREVSDTRPGRALAGDISYLGVSALQPKRRSEYTAPRTAPP